MSIFKETKYKKTFIFTVLIVLLGSAATYFPNIYNARKYSVDSRTNINSTFDGKTYNYEMLTKVKSGDIYFTRSGQIDLKPGATEFKLGEQLDKNGKKIGDINIELKNLGLDVAHLDGYNINAVVTNNLGGISVAVSIFNYGEDNRQTLIAEVEGTKVRRILKIYDEFSVGYERLWGSLAQLKSGEYIYSYKNGYDSFSMQEKNKGIWFVTDNSSIKYTLKDPSKELSDEDIDNCNARLFTDNNNIYIANCTENGNITKFDYKITNNTLELANPKDILTNHVDEIDIFSVSNKKITVKYQLQGITLSSIYKYNLKNNLEEKYDLLKINFFKEKFGYIGMYFTTNYLQIDGDTLYLTTSVMDVKDKQNVDYETVGEISDVGYPVLIKMTI